MEDPANSTTVTHFGHFCPLWDLLDPYMARKAPHMAPKGPHMTPKASQMTPKASQMVSKGRPRSTKRPFKFDDRYTL